MTEFSTKNEKKFLKRNSYSITPEERERRKETIQLARKKLELLRAKPSENIEPAAPIETPAPVEMAAPPQALPTVQPVPSPEPTEPIKKTAKKETKPIVKKISIKYYQNSYEENDDIEEILKTELPTKQEKAKEVVATKDVENNEIRKLAKKLFG